MSRKARKHQSESPTFYDFVRAAVCDQKAALQMLRDNPSWIDAESSANETALHYLVVENYIDAARFLLAQGASVEGASGSSCTPLTDAALLGYPEMVALLIEHGADLEARNLMEETALLAAARNGYADICDMLLDAGADVSVHDDFDNSVWDTALPRKRHLIADVLRKHGYEEPSGE
jgi:ankyrin repeat protein